MELKSIDFHNHSASCSLKCQSRNYIKNRKSEMNQDMNALTAGELARIESNYIHDTM